MADDRGTAPFPGGTQQVFPKRFYQAATVAPEEGGFGLRLDSRPARTPARNPIVLPTAAAAGAVADEWAAVETTIDPREMPMTRLVNSVIDGVARNRAAVLAEVVRYAGSDLLVYRAEEPAELVRLQQSAWDPILAWSRETFGAALVTASGIMFVEQPPLALERLARAADELTGAGPAAPFRLGSLHVITTLTGSALIGLAVLAERLDAASAWAAAHVDEDFQISQWGRDSEAAERRARRWIDMDTAARLAGLVDDRTAEP